MPSATLAAAPYFTELREEHLDGADRGERVDRALPDVIGRGAADRLEHADAVAG